MIVAAIDWGITIPILIALVAGVAVGHLMRQARTKSKKARAEREALARRAVKKQASRPPKTSDAKLSPAARPRRRRSGPGDPGGAAGGAGKSSGAKTGDAKSTSPKGRAKMPPPGKGRKKQAAGAEGAAAAATGTAGPAAAESAPVSQTPAAGRPAEVSATREEPQTSDPPAGA